MLGRSRIGVSGLIRGVETRVVADGMTSCRGRESCRRERNVAKEKSGVLCGLAFEVDLMGENR